MDLMYVVSGLASTTKEAGLALEPYRNMAMYVSNKQLVFRKGEWIVLGIQPTPGEGLKLEEWETVFAITARYTAPFRRRAIGMGS